MTTKSREGQSAPGTERPLGTDYYHIEFLDSDKVSEGSTTTTTVGGDTDSNTTYCWSHTKDEEKIKVATDILYKLLDFNIKQLSRTDKEKVLIYEEPAKFAASLVNELYENIE